jgi:HAD superfamily phosphoserine phosphatase-like hydrolase
MKTFTSRAPTMRVAFFDFDHTLLCADSNQLWIDYLHEHGLLNAEHIARHAAFMRDYHQGNLDFTGLQTFRHAVDAAIAPDRLMACRATFTRDRLLAAVEPHAQALLDDLRRDHVLTMVVSASREALVLPVARHLGFEHVLAADSAAGEAIDAPCFGHGKISHVEGVLAGLGASLAELDDSWFYSDSHNDLPLLEAVRHPVAVDPDPVLAQVARQRRWRVISLREAP